MENSIKVKKNHTLNLNINDIHVYLMDNLSIPILFHEQEDVDREIFVVKDSFSKNSRR